ncbi:MAG: SDR family oxidoreductase [Candidatus Eremiobacteraeota bacterium]|nr:SDR family oxidoreductase [Candidatus Eremiobacteraeota bacterium]MBC5827755.1 SDR family oxidoreductase [Candidatus Eremiobacteraeota bacterium]
MELLGQTALVTGASRGLGFALASLLAQRGVNVIVAAREGRSLEAAADRLRGQAAVLAVTADVSEDAERIVAVGVERFGVIDILINNASELGPSPLPSIETLPWTSMERILRVNVTAPLHLMQLVLPGMKSRGAGTIVNVTSDAAVNAYPGWGGYGASKAALEHMSRTLAVELNQPRIRVLTVDPGDMDTEMHRAAEPGADLSALPKPESVAPSIIGLLEDDRVTSGRYQARWQPTPLQPR